MHPADSSPFTAQPARPLIRRRPPAESRIAPDTRVVVIGQGADIHPTEVASAADPRVVWPGDEPLLQLAGYQRSELALVIKRGIDIVGAVVGLVFATPVLLVLAMLIRLESKGSPFFRHTRVTSGGRRFGCLKLRTMRSDVA